MTSVPGGGGRGNNHIAGQHVNMADNQMMNAGGQAAFAQVRVDYTNPNANATLYMNSGASFRADGGNSFTIDRNAAQGNYQQQQYYQQQQPMYTQYPGYYAQPFIPQQQHQYMQPAMTMVAPQAPPQQQQQPPPPRTRNILKIEDPNTHEEVKLESASGSNGSAATPNTTIDPEIEKQKVARRKEILSQFGEKLKLAEPEPAAEAPKEAEQPAAPVEAAKTEAPAVVAEPVKEEPVPEPVKEEVSQPEEVVPVVVEAPAKEATPEVVVAEPVVVDAVTEVTASLEKVTIEEKVETEITPASPDIPSLQIIPTDEEVPSPSVVVEEAPEAEEEATSPSPDAEEEERRREEEEAARVRAREAELDALHAELLKNTEEVDIATGFYNRAFLYCVRDIEKEFKRTKCPLTMEQLKGYGLDIHSMPKSSGDGKKGGRTDFNPPWAQRNSMQGRGGNRPYSGRNSHDHRGGGGGRGGGSGGKKPYGPRISIDRPQERKVTLGNRAENAWKAEKLSAEDMEKEENRIKVLLKAVRSLLNKITPTTKDELMKEWLALQVSGAKFDAPVEQLSEVVNIMFDKAVEEPKFCSLYSEICKKQVDHEVKYNEKKSSVFRNALLNRAQTTFVNKTMDDNKKALDEETDEIKKKQMEIEFQEAFNKFRRRKFGNINFIGQLYGQHLLSTKIIQWCLYDLMRHAHPDSAGNLPPPPYDEESLMCATQLIEAVGQSFEKCTDFPGAKEYLNQLFQHLNKLAANCTPKIKFKIMGVMELRNSNWKQRNVVDQGPKKLSEIHKQIAQEQVDLQNQRDNYERKQSTGIRMGSNSLRRNAPPPSRNSLDSRVSSVQKKAGAAIASKMTVSTAAPRQMSMSMANTGTGLQKKSWKGGSAGGGNANEAGGSRTGWGRNNGSREGSESRKNSTVDEKTAALAAAGAIAGGQRSNSQLSVHSQEDASLNADNEEQRLKLVGIISSRFDELADGEITMEDMIGDLFGFAGVERFANPKVADVFQRYAQCFVDKLKPTMKPKAIEVLCEAMKDAAKKPEIIQGLQQFCSWAIQTEMWEDKPKFWELFAELLAGSVLFEPAQTGGEDDKPAVNMTALDNFSPVFVDASKDPRKSNQFTLIVTVLRLMAEGLTKHEDGLQGLGMDYEDLSCKKQLDEKALNEALKACRPDVPNFNNLYDVLHH